LKWLWHKITNWLGKVATYLGAFGAFGVFIVGALDATFVPMPGGVDAITLLLSHQTPEHWWLYATAATLGSVVGCVVLYEISRRAGRRALSRFSEKRQQRVKELIERYDVFAVIVASLAPPPFPFKVFVVSAGVFRFPLLRFAVAIAAGRAFRFFIEAYLAARYGDQAKDLFAHYYPYVALVIIALIVVFFVVKSLLKKRTNDARASA
jgi:membrane protein YqaA with SNARE-associated domain